MSATWPTGTDRPVDCEKTLVLPMVLGLSADAPSDRRVIGMILSPSRNSVVSKPENSVMKEMAMSWFVTPARCARCSSILSSIFFERAPQSSEIDRGPERPAR